MEYMYTHNCISNLCLKFVYPQSMFAAQCHSKHLQKLTPRDLVLGHPRPWWWKNGSMIWEDKKVVETKKRVLWVLWGINWWKREPIPKFVDKCKYTYLYAYINISFSLLEFSKSTKQQNLWWRIQERFVFRIIMFDLSFSWNFQKDSMRKLSPPSWCFKRRY